MRIIWVLITLLIFSSGCQKNDSTEEKSDQAQFIEEVQSNKMTEIAETQLITVAATHLGNSILEFVKSNDNSMYWPSYRSNTCPNPDATKDEQKSAQQREMAKIDKILPVLIAAADSDDSGFVSTKEAQYLRRIYEFGFQYKFVNSELNGDWSQYGPNFDMSESDLEAWIAEFNKISDRVPDNAINFMEPMKQGAEI